MSRATHNVELNQLLVRLYRNLLQYVDECWPWTDIDDASERQVISDIASRQQEFVGQLVDVLRDRGWAVRFDNYPTNFTDLQYLALDYLLNLIIADETELIAGAQRVQSLFSGDETVYVLLTNLIAAEQKHLAQLRTLAAPRTVAAMG